LIEHYQNQHYPIEAPDPIEAIKIRMNVKLTDDTVYDNYGWEDVIIPDFKTKLPKIIPHFTT
jgi:hypothetical protein